MKKFKIFSNIRVFPNRILIIASSVMTQTKTEDPVSGTLSVNRITANTEKT